MKGFPQTERAPPDLYRARAETTRQQRKDGMTLAAIAAIHKADIKTVCYWLMDETRFAAAGEDWTTERMAMLTELWQSGLVTQKIGDMLGVTKNSVLGKVHRLVARGLLTSRPSPLKNGPATLRNKPGPKPKPKITLPAPAWLPTSEPYRSVWDPPKKTGRVTACQWPIGNPGTKGFRFCENPSSPGASYCAKHHAICYVRVRDRHENAVY